MGIRVYSKDNCPNCVKIKDILNNKGIQFEEIRDIDKAIIVGSANGIRSLPILDIEGKILDFSKAKEYLESV